MTPDKRTQEPPAELGPGDFSSRSHPPLLILLKKQHVFAAHLEPVTAAQEKCFPPEHTAKHFLPTCQGTRTRRQVSPGASERQHQLALLELSALQSRLQIQAFFFPLKKKKKKKNKPERGSRLPVPSALRTQGSSAWVSRYRYSQPRAHVCAAGTRHRNPLMTSLQLHPQI